MSPRRPTEVSEEYRRAPRFVGRVRHYLVANNLVNAARGIDQADRSHPHHAEVLALARTLDRERAAARVLGSGAWPFDDSRSCRSAVRIGPARARRAALYIVPRAPRAAVARSCHAARRRRGSHVGCA